MDYKNHRIIYKKVKISHIQSCVFLDLQTAVNDLEIFQKKTLIFDILLQNENCALDEG